MSLDVYRRLWNDDRLNGLALILASNADPDTVTTDLRAHLIDFPNVQVNPSRLLRQDAMAIFDRTFAITAAMQLITTLVAFIGVLSSLLALQLEKAREMGILRALGLTIAEMRRLTLWETGLLGASAGLLSLPTGYILAWILIFIINQRSFGWTLQMQVNLAPFVEAFLLSVGAALLAAFYPLWRLSHMEIAEALRARCSRAGARSSRYSCRHPAAAAVRHRRPAPRSSCAFPRTAPSSASRRRAGGRR